jgi:acetyl-CoA C-acetyltransferase
MDPRRTPVIVAAGQATLRDENVNAVEMAARAAEAALARTGALRDRIQRLSMVSVVFSPVSARPASELAARLGLAEAAVETTTPGGNLPQWLVTRAAAEIAEGRLDTTLLAGGEATRSMRESDPDANFMGAARRPKDDSDPDPVVGPSMMGVLSRAEIAIRLFEPAHTYPLFENALAHAHGRSFDEQRAVLGPLMARFSEVAAKHPYAWFREALSAREIATPSEHNRLIAEPYTKEMNAFPHVDQGAAVILTSLATARDLGLEDRCVFVWSGANLVEPPPVSRRDLSDAPAMRAAAAACLDAAGVCADQLGLIDLYSCFPIAVEVGAAGLGVPLSDARELTVTGGLPFFGGPGNDYSMHAIATVAERLRESGDLAYVGANGGLLSKHAMGVYGATPPPRGFVLADTEAQQARIDADALPFTVEAEGGAVVVASTVVYGRDGSVQDAPVIATLDDGRRIAARADASLRSELSGRSLIGARIRVSGSPLSYRLESD